MADVTIDNRLNLVVPVELADGSTLYVHSQPISRAVFHRYFKVISRAFAEIYNGGHGITGGPRIASLLIRDIAEQMGIWDDVQQGLVNEINRLTNVLVLGPAGWSYIPYEEAVRTGKIDEYDADEVANALAFFTVASSMHHRRDLGPIMTAALRIWNGHCTSSNVTGYGNSLTISTSATVTVQTEAPKAEAPQSPKASLIAF